jgi:anhydro-N-acetylmuramic acid kinase
MNDWVKLQTGADFDRDGSLGRQGKVDRIALAELLDHGFFGQSWPKSLDRDAFSLAPVALLSPADGVATLAAFTVRTLADGLAGFPQPARSIVICGGGARNPLLMELLADAVAVPVTTMDALGLQADYVEAQAFAYCAIRSARDLPITFPGTTGIGVPLSGGRLASPRQ